MRRPLSGITLVEVVLAISLVTVFCASALSAFLMNQAYSSLSIYNSQANRLNQTMAETVLSTNYSGLTNFAVTNYDFIISHRNDNPEFENSSPQRGGKEFQTRPSSRGWVTNLTAAVAFETEVLISEKGSYREADVRTFWFFNGKFMTNSLTLARADDR